MLPAPGGVNTHWSFKDVSFKKPRMYAAVGPLPFGVKEVMYNAAAGHVVGKERDVAQTEYVARPRGRFTSLCAQI